MWKKHIITLISSLFYSIIQANSPLPLHIPPLHVPQPIVQNYSEYTHNTINLNFKKLPLITAASFNTPLAAKFDSIQNTIPSYMTYNGSWDNDKLNTFKLNIDSLIDSVNIDCTNFVYPTKSNHVTSNFGTRWYRFHYGIDLGLHTGDTIRASFSGKIRILNYERYGYGNYIVIRHDNGLETIYAHLHRTLVKKNQTVKAGDVIGLGGNTGRSTGPHLHFEIRYQGQPFNPNKIINFATKQLKIKQTGKYLLTINETYSHKTTLAKLKQAQYCRVRPGDTLSHIARRYRTSVSKLCNLNKIKSTSILQIGQRVRYR